MVDNLGCCMSLSYVSEIDRVNTSVTGPNGFITSPHYPLSYPHNVDYTYSFNINRTQTVGLYFYSFNLEGTARSYLDSCHYDWLLVSSLVLRNSVGTLSFTEISDRRDT